MAAKNLIAGMVRVAYHVCSCLPKKRIIAFLSRQSARPFDFRLIEDALAERFPDYEIRWACVPSIGNLGVRVFLQQLKLVATARLCFVDGYVPAVSIPRRHHSTCIQMWHAAGAVKKFGYQCLDTPAGRTRADAKAFRMHRGYDWIIAGMSGAVDAFAHAFDAPAESILPLGLPRLDYLTNGSFAERRRQGERRVRRELGLSEDDGRTIVLYAPTFRKRHCDPVWLTCNIENLACALEGKNALLVVAGHPLEVEGADPKVADAEHVAVLHEPTINALHCADAVISDYSAVALEAGLIGKPVAFYVPDIAEYRLSPGLNIDPLERFPEEAFERAEDLAAALFDEKGRFRYESRSFAAFVKDYAAGMPDDAIAQIIQLVSGIIAE